jgi:hypothetical protein
MADFSVIPVITKPQKKENIVSSAMTVFSAKIEFD